MAQGLPYPGIDLGEFIQSVHQGIHIEATAPHQDQDVVAVEQSFQEVMSLPLEVPYRIGFIDAFVLAQMVWCRSEFLFGGYRGPNADFPIELPGIGGDDLGVE